MSANDISQQEIGNRLRLARENANLTQSAASESLDLARTTLVAIEQGRRRVRIDELQQMAKLYGVSANSLLRRNSVHRDLVPMFRKNYGTENREVQSATMLLSSLATAEVEMENLLGIDRASNLPPERPLKRGDVLKQAEEDALELRYKMGIGQRPIRDVADFVASEFGVRVYIQKINGQISGLFAFDVELGACMLLNANHRIERRNQTAAHELGHLVATRRSPEVFFIKNSDVDFDLLESKAPSERYATVFGRNFLTPGRAVMMKFEEVTAGSTRLTRRHVILLANVFGVSREAMVRRLEELKLARPGTWEWFQDNGGITDEHVRKVIGEVQYLASERDLSASCVPMRLAVLASEVFRRGLLSEGQLAQLLNMDRVDLRTLLQDIDIEGDEPDAAPMLP